MDAMQAEHCLSKSRLEMCKDLYAQNVCMYIYIYIDMYTYVHTDLHTFLYVHTDTRTYPGSRFANPPPYG